MKPCIRSILAVLATVLFLMPSSRARASEPLATPCDPDVRGQSWTRAQKAETRARVRAACERLGGSDTYCAWHVASVIRESWGGIATAVCTKGVDADGDPELGFGAYCLSRKFHGDKWPGTDEDPAWCTPEASFLVAHDIAWRAVERYGADDAVEIQAIFGGGRGSHLCETTGYADWVFEAPVLGQFARVIGLPRRARACRATPQLRHVRSVCNRMGSRGCRAKIHPGDLGRKVPLAERRAVARQLARGQGS